MRKLKDESISKREREKEGKVVWQPWVHNLSMLLRYSVLPNALPANIRNIMEQPAEEKKKTFKH